MHKRFDNEPADKESGFMCFYFCIQAEHFDRISNFMAGRKKKEQKSNEQKVTITIYT